MLKVAWVWVDAKGKQVGVRIVLESGAIQDVSLQDESSLQGKLSNAVVTAYGVRGKAGITLEHKLLVKSTGVIVETYTLMHADTVVLRVYSKLGKVEIVTKEKIPFSLIGEVLTVTGFMDWLNMRIDNLARMYMNKVYVVRKVGRDREAILRDSCGISPIDNFWICRSDVNTSWSELKMRRDINKNLVNVALTGKMIEPPNFKELEKDTTTLFTLKGAFPKAIYREFLLKKDSNANYEVVASELAYALGISVAEAVKMEQIGVVGCKLFTTEAHSMAHARDFLHLTDYAQAGDDVHRAVYEYFVKLGRKDIALQLERLYLFNYLVENTDFHYENFGFLYDSSTFKILCVAPGYDFNSAFDGYNDVMVYYVWILQHLAGFMRNNADIRERLRSMEFIKVLMENEDLTEEQKNSIQQRADYLCSL